MPLPDNINSIKNLFAEIKIDNADIVDLWTSWQLSQEIKEKVDGYSRAIVGEGDTWHSISEQVYQTRELWWILAMYNDVEDPFSIFYDSSIQTKASEIKLPDQASLGIIINDIREKRVRREIDG
jgi:nucleoid-associated protein YgaU